MKIKEPGTGLMSGKFGNVVYYVMDGKQYVRRAAIAGKKRKSEKSGLPETQQKQMSKFAFVQWYYQVFKEKVSPVIWKLAAAKEGHRPQNLFHQTNSHCFSNEPELVDFAQLAYSRGVLHLPREIAVERVEKGTGEAGVAVPMQQGGAEKVPESGGRYRVTWVEERTGALEQPTDRLWVGVVYESQRNAPCVAQEVSGTRGDGEGWFTLKETLGLPAHVYIFFEREDGTAFSDSFHVAVER